MNDTFRLGRVAGIPIDLNWTWLIVFALFVWSLGGRRRPYRPVALTPQPIPNHARRSDGPKRGSA